MGRAKIVMKFLGAAVAALICAGATARNDKLYLPTQPVLQSKVFRQMVGDDMAIRFGSALPAGAVVINKVVMSEGVADPRHYSGRPLGDEENCRAALRNALSDLVSQARKSGANALVGVISNYEGTEFDSPGQYECHAGTTRGVVALKGMTATLPPARAPNLAAAASAPQPAQGAKEHLKRVPPASGFAAGNDASAVPLSEEGKGRYRHYLSLPSPKAFTINVDGGWRFYFNDAEAMTKALDRCARDGKPCWLYAVDDTVVWDAEVSKRIARSAQLVDRAGQQQEMQR